MTVGASVRYAAMCARTRSLCAPTGWLARRPDESLFGHGPSASTSSTPTWGSEDRTSFVPAYPGGRQ